MMVGVSERVKASEKDKKWVSEAGITRNFS